MTVGALGERMRVARTSRGLSLRRLAALTECTPSLLSQIETGKNLPSVTRLVAIATHLGVSVDHLLGLSYPDAPLLSSGQVITISLGVGGSVHLAPNDTDPDSPSGGTR